MNQCCYIMTLTIRSKFQCNWSQNATILIQENLLATWFEKRKPLCHLQLVHGYHNRIIVTWCDDFDCSVTHISNNARAEGHMLGRGTLVRYTFTSTNSSFWIWNQDDTIYHYKLQKHMSFSVVIESVKIKSNKRRVPEQREMKYHLRRENYVKEIRYYHIGDINIYVNTYICIHG